MHSIEPDIEVDKHLNSWFKMLHLCFNNNFEFKNGLYIRINGFIIVDVGAIIIDLTNKNE